MERVKKREMAPTAPSGRVEGGGISHSSLFFLERMCFLFVFSVQSAFLQHYLGFST